MNYGLKHSKIAQPRGDPSSIGAPLFNLRDDPNASTSLMFVDLLLLRATHRLGEAEPLYRRALTIVEESLGAEHPSTRMVHDNYAALLSDLGQTTPGAVSGL